MLGHPHAFVAACCREEDDSQENDDFFCPHDESVFRIRTQTDNACAGEQPTEDISNCKNTKKLLLKINLL